MEPLEIDEGAGYIGYREALELVYASVHPIGVEEIDIVEAAGRIAAEDIVAKINNPTQDVSLKDGFAVKSADVAHASFDEPARMRIIGYGYAGVPFTGVIQSGTAAGICSGSPIPQGADAVVSIEFCTEIPPEVLVKANAEPGRNILPAGEDIKTGSIIIEKGNVLLPGFIGLIAAAGIEKIKVFCKPGAAVIAIGDEVVAPGRQLKPGQLYASNIVTIGAWLSAYAIPFKTGITGDDGSTIRQEILDVLPDVDTVITSGGVWGSERDMVAGVLDEMGWNKLFHHVRMGPGKGIVFGLLRDKPVVCLPGGPASNEMAFLQFALPGILRMSGQTRHPLQSITAKLTEDIKGRHPNWTEFKDATLSLDKSGNYVVTPYRERSRLQAIARANCLICLPEGKKELQRGDTIVVQVLMPTFGGLTITR
jgi:molybdopterin molybdotransferase